MKRHIRLLRIALSLGLAATGMAAENTPSRSKNNDSDIGEGSTPLDAAVRKNAPESASSSAAAPAAANSSTKEEQAPAPATPAAVVAALPLAAPNLPAVPQGALNAVSQINGLDLSFQDTPLDEVVRSVCRYIDRPVHVSTGSSFKITRTWKNASPVSVLADIASLYGLVFRETANGYFLEDGEKPLSLASLPVKSPPAALKVTPVSDYFVQSQTVIAVPSQTGRQYDRTMAKVVVERAKLLAERERLERNSR